MSRDICFTNRTTQVGIVMSIAILIYTQSLLADEQEKRHQADHIESEISARSILVQTSYEEVDVAEPPLPWAAEEPIQSKAPSKYEISWAFRESNQTEEPKEIAKQANEPKSKEPEELDLAKLIKQNSRPIEESPSVEPEPELNKQSFFEEKLLTAKQLELVAAEADTTHKLTRVINHAELSLLELYHDEAESKKIHSIASWALVTRGQMKQSQGHRIEALQDYSDALSHNPDSFAARQCRGVLLAKTQQMQEALVDFDQAIELNPDSLSMRYNRASLLLSIGEVEKSFADADYALMLNKKRQQISPRMLTSLYELHGTASHLLGKQTKAYHSYTEALKHSESKGHLLLKRGSLFASEGIYQQAIEDLLASIEEGTHSATAYRRLAWLLATCEDQRYRNTDQAVEAVLRARKLVPVIDAELEEITAKVYAANGDYSKAMQHQQQAILLTEDAEIRASYQVQLSDYQEADRSSAPLSNKAIRRASHSGKAAVSK